MLVSSAGPLRLFEIAAFSCLVSVKKIVEDIAALGFVWYLVQTVSVGEPLPVFASRSPRNTRQFINAAPVQLGRRRLAPGETIAAIIDTFVLSKDPPQSCILGVRWLKD